MFLLFFTENTGLAIPRYASDPLQLLLPACEAHPAALVKGIQRKQAPGCSAGSVPQSSGP